MKTELALLMLTDGRPSMTLEELAKLRNIDPRTAMNQCGPSPVLIAYTGSRAPISQSRPIRAATAARMTRRIVTSVGPVDVFLILVPGRVERHVDAHGSFDQRGPKRRWQIGVLRFDHRAHSGDAFRLLRREIVLLGWIVV